GKAQLWDTQSGKPLGEALVHQDAVRAVAFRPDGKLLATGTGNAIQKRGEARLWDVKTGICTGVIPCAGPVYAVAFSPDGRTLLLGGLNVQSWKGEVQLWHLTTGTARVLRVPEPRVAVTIVGFSPDGEKFLTVSSNQAQICSLPTGES